MLVLGGRAGSIAEARALGRAAIADGSALDRFRGVIAAQGGDPRVVDDPGRLPSARFARAVLAPRAGVVQSLSARAIGRATMRLGAGRARVDSPIDPAVGVILHKKIGDRVADGEPLATILANDEGPGYLQARALVEGAFLIGESPVAVADLIVERLLGDRQEKIWSPLPLGEG
ncbi:MAG TPA: hypothetical protein VF590_27180, partial [Isosphaeraceae bacterium]